VSRTGRGAKAHHRRVTLRFTRPTVVAALILAIPLAGCGYKGPLYLSKPKPDERKAPVVVSPEPPPDRPVPSEAAPAPK
jgi:predicted small lipoprotein YifL